MPCLASSFGAETPHPNDPKGPAHDVTAHEVFMTSIVPLWAYALLPILLLVAALFWGAPPIALVSELITMVGGKPFPARTARQVSRLAVLGNALFWLTALIGAILLFGEFWQSEFATVNRLLLVTVTALPFFGTLVLIAYDMGWKGAKERRLMHFLLGCLANVPIKYGYWGLVLLALLFFRPINLDNPAFLPPWGSALWPLAGLWPPLALGLAASLSLCYLLLRREADDWGRDYYRHAAPFLAKWHLAGGLITLGMTIWQYASLKGVFNLHLPQIFYAGLAALVCLVLAMVLSAFLCASENPMRLKGSMLAIALLTLAHASLFVVAVLETLNRYVPGWSVPTFMPEVLGFFS